MSDLHDLIQQLDQSDTTLIRERILTYGTEAIAPLRNIMHSGTPRQVANAVLIFGELADNHILPDLIAMLSHKHLLVRMNTAQVLGNFRHDDAFYALMKALPHEREIVQIWIIQSLGQLRDRRAIDPLITLLHSTMSESLRYTTLQALGNIPDEESIAHVKLYINDPSRHVQRYAQEALAKLEQEIPCKE